jgi:hypothetical protein
MTFRIGYFGDSYVDLEHGDDHEGIVWGSKLLKELGFNGPPECISSGLGGSNQYAAILGFQCDVDKFDEFDDNFAIFTFTWLERFFHGNPEHNAVHRAFQEGRADTMDYDYDEYNLAYKLYYKYLYEFDQKMFEYELMVKYIMELPAQYPHIKFIFLPNVEMARPIARKYFTKGLLLDFAFETITNNENSATDPMPCMDDRKGHLEEANHTRFAKYMGNLIKNYDNYENQIVKFDYHLLDLKEYPVDTE